jgi:hypothetical protein
MQKPKYWVYNPKTNSGREIFYNKDYFIVLFGKEIFADGVFPSSDGESYLIKYSYSDLKGEWDFYVYEWKTDQEERNLIWHPRKILMGFVKDIEIPKKIKNKILSEFS